MERNLVILKCLCLFSHNGTPWHSRQLFLPLSIFLTTTDGGRCRKTAVDLHVGSINITPAHLPCNAGLTICSQKIHGGLLFRLESCWRLIETSTLLTGKTEMSTYKSVTHGKLSVLLFKYITPSRINLISHLCLLSPCRQVCVHIRLWNKSPTSLLMSQIRRVYGPVVHCFLSWRGDNDR